MQPDELFSRFQELRHYVGWTEDDAARLQSLAPIVTPHFPMIVEDFYAEIERHPKAHRVITGGTAQVERLKRTLITWLAELFSGRYDADYVLRRWKVGYRHVEIGLDQVYTNVAMSRLRSGLVDVVTTEWPHDPAPMWPAIQSLHKRLDLDLAIIEDAYQTEYNLRTQRVERLATIGQVAGGIAHEVRNPLNVIKTSVYYLLHARSATPEKRAEHLTRIENQVGIADGVITALSDFARLPLPNLRPFSVEEALRDTLDEWPVPAGIDVCVDCPGDLPRALGDVGQCRIVFRNLIRNAFDAMPNGGRLSIGGAASGSMVDVFVSDTGQGIESADLARIMEPLFTTKARGIGLGLAIARAIVDKNNGEIRVESQPCVGTTFTIRLHSAVSES